MSLPHPTNILHTEQMPPLPASWSELTWQQLCDVWTAKIRYGGNHDVAVCAALLALTLGSKFQVSSFKFDETTGENIYLLKPETLNLKPETSEATYAVTARELAWMAKQALPWFAYPYGDAGDKEERDDQGKVIKDRREGHQGYVNPGWRDAMVLPESELVVCDRRIIPVSQRNTMSEEERHQTAIHFALPELACNNLTWHQYRTLQGLTPQLFQEGTSDEQTLELQAQFLAAMLVPEQTGSRGHDRFEKQHPFKYDADRAEQSQQFWLDLLHTPQADGDALPAQADVLFHICFQVYQTAMRYYEVVFPPLFSGSGKDDPLRDALTGEVGTINAVMKYAGYGDQQQVYDANLPFILDILNTMTKEAKEIEKMNQQIKSRSHR